jgi:hypothetical protein
MPTKKRTDGKTSLNKLSGNLHNSINVILIHHGAVHAREDPENVKCIHTDGRLIIEYDLDASTYKAAGSRLGRIRWEDVHASGHDDNGDLGDVVEELVTLPGLGARDRLWRTSYQFGVRSGYRAAFFTYQLHRYRSRTEKVDGFPAEFCTARRSPNKRLWRGGNQGPL